MTCECSYTNTKKNVTCYEKKKVTSHCKWSTPPLVPFSSSRRGHREQWRRAGGVGRDRILAGSSTWPGRVSSEDGRGRARPRLRGACARVRPGRPSRGKGMGDGGWPGGPTWRWRGEEAMDPHAPRRAPFPARGRAHASFVLYVLRGRSP